MHRITDDTASPDLHGPGKAGFTGGDTTTGVPSTRLTPAWCNAVQEEIARAVEAAGLPLNATDNSQLAQAMAALAAQHAFSGLYGDLTGAPTLAPVATSGAYGDLSGGPDLSGYALTSTGAWVEASDSAFAGDLNTLPHGGFYTAEIAAEATNAPPPLAGQNCHVSQFAQASGTDTAQQIAVSATGTRWFFRGKWGGGAGGNWGSWYEVWHSGNDGAGSTLDADLLDGLHAAQVPGNLRKWVVFNQQSTTITASDGISSITDHGTGLFTVTFGVPFGSAAYVPMGMCNGDGGYAELLGPDPDSYVWSASAIRMRCTTSGDVYYLMDCNPVAVAFGGAAA